MTAKTWIFPFKEEQRNLFKTGELWLKWAGQYPDIFDKDDLRLVKSQASLGYHYYEWLAAVLMYQCTGYLSLVEKYGFENHSCKQEILKRLLPPNHHQSARRCSEP